MNHRDYNELKSMVKQAMTEAIAKEAGYINNELAGDLLRTLGKRARNVTPKSNAFHNEFAPAQNQAKLDFLGDGLRSNASRYLAAKAGKPTYIKDTFSGSHYVSDTMTGDFSKSTDILNTAAETRAPSRSVRKSYDSAMADAKRDFLGSRAKARHTAESAMTEARLGRVNMAAIMARVAKEDSVGSSVSDHAKRYLAAKNGRPQYQDSKFYSSIRDTFSGERV